MSCDRKSPHETVAAFIRRCREVQPPLKRWPDWVFSWWLAVTFVLVVIVLPIALMIGWTHPWWE